jgi:hypothetical protein
MPQTPPGSAPAERNFAPPGVRSSAPIAALHNPAKVTRRDRPMRVAGQKSRLPENAGQKSGYQGKLSGADHGLARVRTGNARSERNRHVAFRRRSGVADYTFRVNKTGVPASRTSKSLLKVLLHVGANVGPKRAVSSDHCARARTAHCANVLRKARPVVTRCAKGMRAMRSPSARSSPSGSMPVTSHAPSA